MPNTVIRLIKEISHSNPQLLIQSYVTPVDIHTRHSTTVLWLFGGKGKGKETPKPPALKSFLDHTNSFKISLTEVFVFPWNFTLSPKGVALSQDNRAFLLVNVDSLTIVCIIGTISSPTFYIL